MNKLLPLIFAFWTIPNFIYCQDINSFGCNDSLVVTISSDSNFTARLCDLTLLDFISLSHIDSFSEFFPLRGRRNYIVLFAFNNNDYFIILEDKPTDEYLLEGEPITLEKCSGMRIIGLETMGFRNRRTVVRVGMVDELSLKIQHY